MAVAMQSEDFPCLPLGPSEVNKMIKEHSDLFSDSQCKVCSAVLNSESQKLTHYQSKKHANKVRRYLSIQNEEPALKKFKSSTDSDCNNDDKDRSKVCPVCNMTFSSPVVAESHYKGKVHTKNLRLKTFGPQNPVFVPAVASQTAPTAQPKKKPTEDANSVPATGGAHNNNNNNNAHDDDNNNPERFCTVCQANFNNPLMAQQHYVGKKHRKRMTKLKLMETYGPSTAPASTLKGYPCSVCNIELNSVEQYQSHISGAKHKTQIKKSGLNTAEKEHEAEQSHEGENQFNSVDQQQTVADDQFDQYGTGVDRYAGGNNQYTPEDTEYSEEYQYT